ncbi:MAG: 3'-5' exonuclease [Treponema sp.]|nr:3'-5' exonuclease [Treponema sp.]
MESFDWAFAAFEQGAVLTAFDIETTGLDAQRDRIAEFGAVQFDRHGVIARYTTLVNPGISMPPEAGRVNNITDEMLAGKPPIEEALPDFLKFVKNSIIIAHNAPFDCGFVNCNLERLYDEGYAPFPALPNRIADTLPLARRLFMELKRHNLQDLSSALGIRAEAAHRALDDARLCMEIFLQLKKAAEGKQ